ncbi:MAG: UTRA domain-containing protein, partial [Holophaga sp.]|nr:UTRA domain-containing protein [Holophaga sp.]
HREDGVPLQLEDRYVRPDAAPEFLNQTFDTLQPGEYLLQTVPLDEVEHVVEAICASAETAAHLEIQAGDPGLLLTRRTWQGSEVVTFVRCTHPGTRYRLGTRFRSGGSSAVG